MKSSVRHVTEQDVNGKGEMYFLGEVKKKKRGHFTLELFRHR